MSPAQAIRALVGLVSKSKPPEDGRSGRDRGRRPARRARRPIDHGQQRVDAILARHGG
jgi:hypothetical protein